MPKTFNTAEEAETWLRANPMREIQEFDQGDKFRFNPETNEIECNWKAWGADFNTICGGLFPYTVVEEKTITINGKQYREGDIIDGTYTAQHELKRCHVEIVDVYCHSLDLKILHIPDELADKPKEPKTLTWEEFEKENDGWYLHPISGRPMHVGGVLIATYYALKAHLDNGGKLYATREDAQLGGEFTDVTDSFEFGVFKDD